MTQSIDIDGKKYDVDALSAEAKAQLQSLQLTEQLIIQAQQKLAILQTARNAYAITLQEILAGEQPIDAE